MPSSTAKFLRFTYTHSLLRSQFFIDGIEHKPTHLGESKQQVDDTESKRGGGVAGDAAVAADDSGDGQRGWDTIFILFSFNHSMEEKKEENLQDKLAQLKARTISQNPFRDLKLQEGRVSLRDLECEFKKLCDIQIQGKTKEDEKAREAIEEYKLAIMKAFERYLSTTYPVSVVPLEETHHSLAKVKWWYYLLFWFLMLGELFITSIGGGLGLKEMGTKFLGWTGTELYITIGVLLLIENIIFYSIMGPLVKVALGIITPVSGILHQHGQQIKVIQNINHMLGNEPLRFGQITERNYIRYLELLKLFNQSIEQNKMINPPERWRRLKWVLMAITLLLTIANCYFAGSALVEKVGLVETDAAGNVLKDAAGAVLGYTGWGWTIILSSIVVTLLFRAVVRSDTVYKMLNPDMPTARSVKKEFDEFQSKQPEREATLESNLACKKQLMGNDIALTQVALNRKELGEKTEQKVGQSVVIQKAVQSMAKRNVRKILAKGVKKEEEKLRQGLKNYRHLRFEFASRGRATPSTDTGVGLSASSTAVLRSTYS